MAGHTYGPFAYNETAVILADPDLPIHQFLVQAVDAVSGYPGAGTLTIYGDVENDVYDFTAVAISGTVDLTGVALKTVTPALVTKWTLVPASLSSGDVYYVDYRQCR